MPEENAPLLPAPERPDLPALRTSGADFLERLGNRIVDAPTPEEMVWLTRVRGELLRQEEVRKDREHVRALERRQFWTKAGFSGGAVLLGAGLVGTGFVLEGFALMGVGFHWLAPDFVSTMWKRLYGVKDESDGD